MDEPRTSAATDGAVEPKTPKPERRKHRKQTDLRADMRVIVRLLRRMKPYRSRLILGLVTGALYGVISGVFPKMIELGSERLFESGDRPSLGIVMGAALSIPAYFVLRGLMSFLNTYMLSWVSAHMLRDLRIELYVHLQKLSLDFFVRQRIATMIQRVHSNTSAVQSGLVGLAGDIVKQPITILVSIVVLASIDIWFCLFAMVLGIACLIPMSYFGRKVRNASSDEEKSEGALIGILHESFSNVRVIKAYVLEPIQQRRFRKAVNRQMSRSLYFKRQRDIVSPLIEIVGSFGMAAALVYVYLAEIEFSKFIAVIAGFFMMYEPLKRIGRLHVQSQRMLNRAENVLGLLDTVPDMPDRTGSVDLKSFRNEIRFESVRFGYGAHDVLHNVDLTIKRGTVCALVGPSGSGKTSLVNLLLRFYEPSEGRILIDDRDIADLTLISLRKKIGLVTQETLLFADTVADNISSYGRPGASRDAIVDAAKHAHAHEFISALPKGYDTVLSDRGQNISGGQAQRIAIARAFLKNPAILILDEATSALDAESEAQVQEAMAELMRGRTVLIIAHRLSALRRADQFVVLDRGRIVEIGEHDELMQRDGVYRRLYELQVV